MTNHLKATSHMRLADTDFSVQRHLLEFRRDYVFFLATPHLDQQSTIGFRHPSCSEVRLEFGCAQARSGLEEPLHPKGLTRLINLRNVPKTKCGVIQGALERHCEEVIMIHSMSKKAEDTVYLKCAIHEAGVAEVTEADYA